MFATITGALPRVSRAGLDLDDLTAAVDRGTVDRVALDRSVDLLVTEVVTAQELAGLEPITDGQVRTADLHAQVAVALAGVARGADGRLVARGSPRHRTPILVDAWRDTAARTGRAVKQAVPGPYTLGRRIVAAGGSDDGRAARTLALADALAHEIAALAAAGCPLIEVEEPAAVAIGADPVERSLFSEAHRRLLAGAAGIHLTLAIVGGDVSGAGEATLFDLPYASYLFDLIAGPDDWRLIARAPAHVGIVCGALGTGPDAPDDVALLVWAAHYAASTGGRGLDRVGLANASALRGLTPDRVAAKLGVLGEAARIGGTGDLAALADVLDPHRIHRRRAARRAGTRRSDRADPPPP